MNNKVLILGLGNPTHSDDGVGVHVINCLKQGRWIANAEFVAGETLNGDLVHCIETTDCLIVVDMTDMHVQPGAIRVFEGFEMDAFITRHEETAGHQTGLRDALNTALRDGRLPAHRALVGIQPNLVDHGLELTMEVAKAIPHVCCKVFEITENWKI